MMTTVLDRHQNRAITAHRRQILLIKYKSSLTKHYLSMTSSCVWPLN